MSSSEPAGRAIIVAIDVSEPSVAAARWAVQEFWRQGDVIHLVHVHRILAPHVDITHSYAGATYSVPDLKPHAMDQQAVEALKGTVKERFTSWMDERHVPHALHLYLDTDNAPASSICKIIFDVAAEVDAALIVTASHDKASSGFMQDLMMGSVATYCQRNSRWPTIAVREYPPRTPAGAAEGGHIKVN